MQAAGNILIIDDEPSVGDALKLIFEDEGYGVTVAHNGRAGIEHARGKEFRLTITDLHLPDMSGLRVVEEICRLRPGCLVIVITSYGTAEVVADVQRCGAVAVLTKPFLPADILKFVAAHLAPRDQHTT